MAGVVLGSAAQLSTQDRKSTSNLRLSTGSLRKAASRLASLSLRRREVGGGSPAPSWNCSQFRLKKLRQHMEFLSQLAEPRTADEERESAPEVSVGEVAICLELLAEQVSIVLDEVSWPARLQAAKATPKAAAKEDEDDDEEDEDEDEREQAMAAQAAPMDGAPDAEARPRYTFGITLSQVDALARLIQAVSAHGDVVAVGPLDDLADGTLPQLGQAICDAADALRAILDQVEDQGLAAPARPGVAEARAAYCVGPLDGTAGRGWRAGPGGIGIASVH